MGVDSHYLPEGFRLDSFKIIRVLGQGAFGITYLAEDHVLLQKVAIKEYFPREFAVRNPLNEVKPVGSTEDLESFDWGLRKFLEEARVLAKLSHPNIVRVLRFFEAFGTAYLVMEYCEGKTLDRMIKEHGPMPPDQVISILHQLTSGLIHVHQHDYLHRDIKPANIFIRKDNEVVLIDFGAAKEGFSSHSKSATSIASAGYAPFEQYSTRGSQGPWSDIYGMAATTYKLLTGDKPQESPDRMLEDQLVPLSIRLATQYPTYNFLFRALDRALSIKPQDRQRSVEEFLAQISTNETPVHLASPKAPPQKVPSPSHNSPQLGGFPFRSATVFILIIICVSVVLLTISLISDQQAQKVEAIDVNSNESLQKNNKNSTLNSPPISGSTEPSLTNKVDSTSSPSSKVSADRSSGQSTSQTEKTDLQAAKEKQLLPLKSQSVEPKVPSVKNSRIMPATPDRTTTKLDTEKINKLLISSQDCFLTMKFDCAILNADAVLLIDPSNSKALDLRAKSFEAQRK